MRPGHADLGTGFNEGVCVRGRPAHPDSGRGGTLWTNRSTNSSTIFGARPHISSDWRNVLQQTEDGQSLLARCRCRETAGRGGMLSSWIRDTKHQEDRCLSRVTDDKRTTTSSDNRSSDWRSLDGALPHPP